MAQNSIKIKAASKDGITEVKVLIKHDMETGLRKDKDTGEKIPAHFIKEVKCEHNGNVIFSANWGVAVSKDPYLSFQFKGGKDGDEIKVSWVDNKGDTDSSAAPIKS